MKKSNIEWKLEETESSSGSNITNDSNEDYIK